MQGTEKQVKWANDIIVSARAAIKSGKANARLHFPEELDLWEMMEKTYEAHIATIDSAATVIENRKCLDGQAIVRKIDECRAMRARGVTITV